MPLDRDRDIKPVDTRDGTPNQGAVRDRFMTPIYDMLMSGDVGSLTEMVEEKQKELGISDRQLSQVLNISRPSLDRIRNGEAKKIDVLTILKLNQFLGLGIDELLQVFVAGMTAKDVQELERTRAANFIVTHFDLDRLKQIGLIDSVSDLDAIRFRLEQFFGLDHVANYDRDIAYSLFSRVRRPFSDRMLELWVRSAYRQFERIGNPYEYDRETLNELVPQIRQYTRYEQKGLLTVARALYRVGVTVIVQTYLPKTSIRGGTFILDGKPCIALTNLGNRLPTIWFTLLHEIAHILFHWDTLLKQKYHVSGSDDLFLVEEEANYFARELLFQEARLDYIKTFIDAPGIVHNYAEQCNVHPSLIYAFYAWDEHKKGNKGPWIEFGPQMPPADLAVAALKSHPWDKETLGEEADRLREILESNEA